MTSMKVMGKRFTKCHMGLIAFSALLVVFIYGVKMFSYNIGIDTDLWLSGQRFLNHMEIGRFGCVLLKSFWSIGKLNIYAANFFAALFLLTGSILWCVLFDSCMPQSDKGGGT